MISQKPTTPSLSKQEHRKNNTGGQEKTIDSQQITPPKITLTEAAQRELQLMLENDYTLENKVLRIQISGKECHGFLYSCGFTNPESDDFILESDLGSQSLKIALDSFTAFYLQIGEVDFVMEMEKNIEGLTVTNLHQDEYAGKFWKNNKNKVPPTATVPH